VQSVPARVFVLKRKIKPASGVLLTANSQRNEIFTMKSRKSMKRGEELH